MPYVVYGFTWKKGIKYKKYNEQRNEYLNLLSKF